MEREGEIEAKEGKEGDDGEKEDQSHVDELLWREIRNVEK